MDLSHLASYVTNVSTKKLLFQAFFWSATLHRDVQPLPVKGTRYNEKITDDFFLIERVKPYEPKTATRTD